MILINKLINLATNQLATTSNIPRLEAEILLSAALELPRTHLYAYPDKNIIRYHHLVKFLNWIKRRCSGEPIAYLLGYREFWSLKFLVTTDTLIPRQETELLVEIALEQSINRTTIVDIGTGSGAIAIALAKELPNINIIATDCSKKALIVAKTNALRLSCSNIEFRQGDWLQPLYNEKVNLIVSNPPYISVFDQHLTNAQMQFEPKIALISGYDGLDAIRTIITHAPTYLHNDGCLLLEHGYQHGPVVINLLKKRGFINTISYLDLNGHSRVSQGIWRHTQ